MIRKSHRLEGLEFLRLIGLPVPSWQVVRTLRDVDTLDLVGADCGWTIRTCRDDGKREMGQFYLNYAEPEHIRDCLRRRVGRAGRDFYLVYPSWNFRYSCNIVLLDHSFLLEGSYGSQKSLAMGRSGPDFALRIPFGLRSQMVQYAGTASDELLRSIGRVLSWCRRIPWSGFYAEGALKEDARFVFYELMRIEDASELHRRHAR